MQTKEDIGQLIVIPEAESIDSIAAEAKDVPMSRFLEGTIAVTCKGPARVES